jgi:Fur family peroxide stress response transcriptional regulator
VREAAGRGARAPGEIEERVRSFADICRAKGLRLTPQRLSVYRTLLRMGRHPDAESLHREVRRSHPTISLATVYNTLDTLVGLGVVSEVNVFREGAKYEANLAPHHHLVCTRCRRITDFHDSAPARFDLPRDVAGGFRLTHVAIQFLGICADCETGAAVKGRHTNRRKEK